MAQNKLILPGSPLIVCPELVTRLREQGLKRYATDAAVFIQQLHYLLKMPNHGRIIEGIKWIYNSLTKWQKEIEWLTDYTFRTIKNKLIELGIIKAQQLGLNDQGRDRSYWYTINYEHEIFLVEVNPISTNGSSEQSSDAKQAIKSDASFKQSSDVYDPKTTPEITNKITTTSAVATSLRSQYPEAVESYPDSQEPPKPKPVAKAAVIDNSPINSDERINEVRALEIKLSSALRIAVVEAAADVYEKAIASFKEAKAGNRVNSPTAFLLSAIRERWHVPIEQAIESKKARFIEWRKASKANDAAARFSMVEGDCILISSDGKTWIDWELTQ